MIVAVAVVIEPLPPPPPPPPVLLLPIIELIEDDEFVARMVVVDNLLLIDSVVGEDDDDVAVQQNPSLPPKKCSECVSLNVKATPYMYVPGFSAHENVNENNDCADKAFDACPLSPSIMGPLTNSPQPTPPPPMLLGNAEVVTVPLEMILIASRSLFVGLETFANFSLKYATADSAQHRIYN